MTTTLKNKVRANLIKNGNSEKVADQLIKDGFDYASRKYSSVKTISECLVTCF